MSKETTIFVKSALPVKPDGGSQIVLSETDARHPDGHGFVASPKKWVEVFPTARVRELITKGELVEKGAKDSDASDDEETEKGVEIIEGDSPDTLADRYSKDALIAFATDNNIETNPKDTKTAIAEKILMGLQ